MITDEPVRGGFGDPAFFALPGAEQLRMLIRGSVIQPPLSYLVGHRASQVGSGIFTATIPASPWLQHVDGTMDLKTSISILVECAVMTGAPPGSEVRTAGLAISPMRCWSLPPSETSWPAPGCTSPTGVVTS